MKKIMRRLLMIILALIISVPAVAVDCAGASDISVAGGDNVSGGEVFKVTVTYNGDSIGRVAADVTYDTEMLSYISGGSSSGNVGYVELKKAGTGEPLEFELEFQALKEGSTELTISTNEMYDLDEMFMDTPSAVKSVTISGNADEEEIIEETNPEDDNAAEEGLSVDEKEDVTSEETGSEEIQTSDTSENSSDFLGKTIMFSIIGLILILIIIAVLRRRK